MIRSAPYWIEQLRLVPHPEGGYYRQTYKSDLTIARDALPGQFGGDRAACTGIYFLLSGKDFSAFHRIASDEMWHFYAGSALVVYVLDAEGQLGELCLGDRPEEGEVFQDVVKAGCWFASRVKDQLGYSLVGCTVAPGFEYAGFEMAPPDWAPGHR